MFKNYATNSIDVRVSPSGLAVALKVGSPGLESRTEHYDNPFFAGRTVISNTRTNTMRHSVGPAACGGSK